MIGLRAGLKAGPISGLRAGIGTDELAPAGSSTTTQTVALADNSTSGAVITGGDAFAITCTYTNTGSNTATSVSVSITLDANATYVSASGTGWSFSGPTANVLTATRATAAVGAAPVITINLISPASATTLTTTAQATASNASTANSNTDSIAVNLVTKDATLGWYFPANSTEWTNFIARKNLSVAVPDALWLCQELSGNLVDSIGLFPLTASGTGIAYNQTIAGIARKALTFTDAGTGAFTSTSTSLPNVATASQFTVIIAKFPTPAATRGVMTHGTTTTDSAFVTATPAVQCKSSTNSAIGATNPTGSIIPFGMQTNRTAATCTAFTDKEKVSPTFSASITGQKILIGAGSDLAMSVFYAWQWHAANAEASNANYKALLLAMGATITWV